MPAPRGYKKVNDKPTFYFNEKLKTKAKGRKDSLPKDMTAEEFKRNTPKLFGVISTNVYTTNSQKGQVKR